MNRKITKGNRSQEINLSLEEIRETVSRAIERKIRLGTAAWFYEVVEEEVNLLCGKEFSHKRGERCHRGGSEKGSIYIDGQRVMIRRPRVRKNGKEVHLNSYDKLNSISNLDEYVLKMMLSGVSTRKYNDVQSDIESGLGLSKSSVSRRSIESTRKHLEKLNTRQFEEKTFYAIVVDGIHVGKTAVIVALGVDTEGNKHFLGIFEGSTENAEAVRELFRSIKERGIKFTKRVICVMDGSPALHRGVEDHFGKNVDIQRCLNHKLWNLQSKLPKKHYKECKIRLQSAYLLNSYSEAKKEMEKTVSWLEEISYNASESLKESMEELLTLHRIQMPPQMRISFYTTNLIDSSFTDPRRGLNRVKKWRRDSDMIQRWVGSHLLDQERKFRKIRGIKFVSQFLVSYLDNSNILDRKKAA